MDGNPHPRPDEEHHHPNQNLIIGPFPVVHNANQDAGNQQDNNNQGEDREDLAEEDPGWGHWAMPNKAQLIDQELHDGEFLELNDLLAPFEENIVQQPALEVSGLTSLLVLQSQSTMVLLSIIWQIFWLLWI